MNGDVIVHYGEVFCRIPRCEYSRIPLSSTDSLRSHIQKHGVMVARNRPGRISQGSQDAVVVWFQALFSREKQHNVDKDQHDKDQ
ncbi:uncharacterized protein N7518_001344 [Penicillium psychrosexuale]|uniref:uncharacterized protein n=1 Tax=Penicillium psychrosexuale TaxID=1002107 RepID=UPI0025453F91|nr:uncharacterized protein N7518_001344 [Penicillium psychrosexuale]KAJ5799276.1 hypothetical protein N7518_001344 [Penicillium psychrosexuale]